MLCPFEAPLLALMQPLEQLASAQLETWMHCWQDLQEEMSALLGWWLRWMSARVDATWRTRVVCSGRRSRAFSALR